MRPGMPCRTRMGAPARYIGYGMAVYISSQDNDVLVAPAADAKGNEEQFPLPSFAETFAAAAGYSAALRRLDRSG